MRCRPVRRYLRDPDTLPKVFCKLINFDHIVAHSEESMGLTGKRDVLVVVAQYSAYMDCFPLPKSAEDSHGAMLGHFGPDLRSVKRTHTDVAPELRKAVQQVGVPH